MSVDLSQFHQVFFEESFEGLDAMESALMELQPEAIDSETINTIFRSAHSIKGGSATFGFSEVADFTHVLETLLDEIRAGNRGISTDDIDLFLQSVDCLRDLIQALQDHTDADLENAERLKTAFQAILDGNSTTASQATQDTPVEAGETEGEVGQGGAQTWNIHFAPAKSTLRTGNDPLRMFRELAELGSLQVDAQYPENFSLSSLEPEDCLLSWQLSLTSDCSKSDIDEIFEWVVDEADLEITLAGPSVTAQPMTEIEAPDATKSICANSQKPTTWLIDFKPHKELLKTGNEPLRMFRELAEYGELHVNLDASSLPAFSAIPPEDCFFSWQLELKASIEQSVIDEIFEWVSDESDVRISLKNALTSDSVSDLVQSSKSDDPAIGNSDNSTNTPLATSENSVVSQPDNSVLAGATSSAVPVKATKSNVKKSSSSETSSIRVGIDKVDSLINMVGELVITQSMLGQLGHEFDMNMLPKLLEGLGQLEHNTRELQESVMRIRMLPISFAFSRFPRMVRDLSRRLNKEIDLQLLGENTELDKTVMEKIGDPLVHLVRNSVDHGIESPEERVASGKDSMGTILLNAYHQGGNVVIEITDDGKGLDRDKIIQKALENQVVNERDSASLTDAQVYDLIFQPGFSTADEVSDVSGRGVGMDVVRRNIQELNGSIELSSNPGKGSKVTIRLPLTLAILDGQLVRVGSDTYIFPLVSIIESLQISADKVSQVAGGCDVFQLRNEYVPIIRLYDVFNLSPDSNRIEDSLLVVVESEGEKVGILVDDLEAQQQVVIKSLEQNYQRIQGVSGATILGDGTVALILDIPGLVNIAGVKHQVNTRITSMADSQNQYSNTITASA